MRESITEIFMAVYSSLQSLEALDLRSVLNEYPKESYVRWVLTHNDGEESVVALSCDEQKSWEGAGKIHLEVETDVRRLSDKWLKDIQSALLALIDSGSEAGTLLDRHNIEHPVNWDAVFAGSQERMIEFTRMFRAPIRTLNPLLKD